MLGEKSGLARRVLLPSPNSYSSEASLGVQYISPMKAEPTDDCLTGAAQSGPCTRLCDPSKPLPWRAFALFHGRFLSAADHIRSATRR